jgi:uncharacterized membrane protein
VAGDQAMHKFKTDLKKNLIAGLLVTVPVALTYIILSFVIRSVDAAMEPVILKVLGEKGVRWMQEYPVPGLGFVLLVIFIILVGLFATNFFGKQVVLAGELILHKIPFVRVIYTSIKKVVDTLSQSETPTFEKMVLITYPREPLKTLGIVCCDTKGEISSHTQGGSVNVFVPTSPNPTTGFLLMVPMENLDILDMSVEDGLKMIISFGMVSASEKGEAQEVGSRDEG